MMARLLWDPLRWLHAFRSNPKPIMRTVPSFPFVAVLALSAPAFAQAPAQAPATASAPSALTAAQQLAVTAMNTAVAPLNDLLAATRAELTATSLAQPRNDADIQRKVGAVASVDLHLALARADALAKIQASGDKLNAEQLLAQSQAGRGGAGGGGRGGPANTSPVKLAPPEVFTAVSQFYDYDRTTPLRALTLGTQDFPTYTREKISFAGAGGSRATAFLGLPKNGTAPYPVILLLDGVGGAKERWFHDATDLWPRGASLTEALFSAGFAVLAMDARHHGERAIPGGYRPAFSARPADRTMIQESIGEDRRAMDFLTTRPEIDANRMGVLGLSMGGIQSFALAAMDARIKVVVAGLTPIILMKETIAIPIAPQTFAGANKSIPILMFMGRSDGFYSVPDAQQLFELIPSPQKELRFHDGGHQPPADYGVVSAEWFKKYLK